MSIMHTTRCVAKETSHRFRASPGSYQGATERKTKGAQGLGDQGRKAEWREERASYSFTSTHPGLWRRTSMSVFMSVVLKRINVLGSLQQRQQKTCSGP